MTLIFSHVSPITGLTAVSDILTSSPASEDPLPISIPFRQEPFAHSNGTDALAGLAQKTVIFGKTMVSWAGSRVVSRAIISAIKEQSEDGLREVDLSNFIESLALSRKELDEVELIYHFDPGERWIERKEWNCRRPNLKDAPDIIVGGSDWNFFENMDFSGIAQLPPYEEVLGQFLSKIAMHAFAEYVGTETLHYMYGGWFEIAYRSSGGFQKLSYGIKLWARQNGVLLSGGPGFLSWYRNGHLNVTTIQVRQVNGVEKLTHDNLIIPDMFNSGPSGPPEVDVDATFMAHVVHDIDQGYQVMMVDHEQRDGKVLSVGPAGVGMNVPSALRKQLLKLTPHPGGRILKMKF